VNNLKLVSLQIDDTKIHFKDGQNYIIGHSNSGKTTIFNCIKYVLGLTNSIVHKHIRQIELVACINENDFAFRREAESVHLLVSHKGGDHKFRARSKELNAFLIEILSPNYVYESNTESILTLLDFCFLSEERSINRRQQWDAINSICGINKSLLVSVEKDIHALKNEVSKNKDFETIIDNFAESLLKNIAKNTNVKNPDEIIEATKERFFDEFKEKEDLLLNSTLKFEKIKELSEHELKSRMLEIEKVFYNINHYAGFEDPLFDNLEIFIKDRSKSMTYIEETFSRFLLILAVSQVAQEAPYNFPSLIINDSYLSFELNNKAYRTTPSILDNLMPTSKGLQYIEFTHKDDIPKEHVVLNLNTQGGLHDFGS